MSGSFCARLCKDVCDIVTSQQPLPQAILMVAAQCYVRMSVMDIKEVQKYV